MAIARKLGLNWQAIADLNHLFWPYVLYPGQVLLLPGKDAGSPPPPVDDSSSGNNNQDTGSNTPSGKTYVVQKGDYLVALGRKFGIPWQELASYNSIGYPYIIYPGQVLKLP